MTDEEFTQLFASIGSVSNAKIIRNKATNYSYGFGFVDYVSADDASRAIASLNGYQVSRGPFATTAAEKPHRYVCMQYMINEAH